MDNVINMSSHKPHMVIPTPDGNAHVMPVSMLHDIAQGRVSIDEIEGKEQVIRAIVAEWLRVVHGHS